MGLPVREQSQFVSDQQSRYRVRIAALAADAQEGLRARRVLEGELRQAVADLHGRQADLNKLQAGFQKLQGELGHAFEELSRTQAELKKTQAKLSESISRRSAFGRWLNLPKIFP